VIAVAGAVIPATSSDASSGAPLQAMKVKGATSIRVDSSRRTLCPLSTERSARLHCTSTFLTYWPPVLVSKSVTKVSLGPGVKGKIGFVLRTRSMKKVTFNSYPLYRFSGDAGPGKANGKGLASYGGTWHVLRAASTSATTAPVKSLGAPAPVAGY
jgi:predicted lipoprotein with Yx(FWY)xxD motif